ncbi:MAG: NCS2 family permease [Planctomycetes bacterium]|nr:NCS2 family permease [Planctomycetota bacterium]
MGRLSRFFRFEESGTCLRTEILAGITTFMTMAYILIVNANILCSAAGEAYRPSIVFATAIASAVACFVMGLAANYPFALAPGMGLNAFFAYTVCLGLGFPYGLALTAVFIEGVIFILLTLTKARSAIIRAIPNALKSATAVGIGLFIALIGLGIDMRWIVYQGTLVSMPGEVAVGKPGFFALLQSFLSPFSTPHTTMALCGLVLLILLLSLRVRGAILLAILGTSAIGWWIGKVSPPPDFSGIPSFPHLEHSFIGSAVAAFGQLTAKNLSNFIFVCFAFLFVDLFDTIGTFMGLGRQAGYIGPSGDLPRATRALLADAVGTVTGALLGTSTVTSYIESASGISEGGRTGLTAVVTGLLFVLTVFFIPIFTAIPSYATGPALVIVGVLMMKSVADIDWGDVAEAIPAFLIVAGIPFFFSIADGLAMGFIAYPLVQLFRGRLRQVSAVMWIVFLVFVVRYALISTGVLPWPVAALPATSP